MMGSLIWLPGTYKKNRSFRHIYIVLRTPWVCKNRNYNEKYFYLVRQPGKTSQLSDCQRSLRRIRFYLSYWLKNDRELTWLAPRATLWSSLVAEGCIWPLLFNVEPVRLLKTLWTKKSLGRQVYLTCAARLSIPVILSTFGGLQFRW